MNLGEQVKEYRKRKGMSQRELAEKTGLSQATISRVETGSIQELKSEALKSLALALGITVDFLIGKTDILEPEIFAKTDMDAAELLDGFQKLSADGRMELLDYLNFLEGRLKSRPAKRVYKKRKC